MCASRSIAAPLPVPPLTLTSRLRPRPAAEASGLLIFIVHENKETPTDPTDRRVGTGLNGPSHQRCGPVTQRPHRLPRSVRPFFALRGHARLVYSGHTGSTRCWSRTRRPAQPALRHRGTAELHRPGDPLGAAACLHPLDDDRAAAPSPKPAATAPLRPGRRGHGRTSCSTIIPRPASTWWKGRGWSSTWPAASSPCRNLRYPAPLQQEAVRLC
jgi:hypothetical protein